jgi:hypothetical protein
MSLVATLKQSQQERTSEAEARYRELLDQAKNLDQYRELLDRNESDDAEAMTALMATLGLSADDVAADFHALQIHRAASDRILTPEKRDELDAGLADALKSTSDEAGDALAKLWAMVPHQNSPLVFNDLLGTLLRSVPPDSRQAAAELSKVNEWSQRSRMARVQHGAAVDADRSAGAEIQRLEQKFPRVLGPVV